MAGTPLIEMEIHTYLIQVPISFTKLSVIVRPLYGERHVPEVTGSIPS